MCHRTPSFSYLCTPSLSTASDCSLLLSLVTVLSYLFFILIALDSKFLNCSLFNVFHPINACLLCLYSLYAPSICTLLISSRLFTDSLHSSTLALTPNIFSPTPS